jgi:hypothetical protein
MSPQLLRLRRVEKERRLQLYGTTDLPEEESTSDEEDEYYERTSRPAKRRRALLAE